NARRQAPVSPDERAAILGRIFARAAREKLTCAGGFTTSLRERHVVTSSGHSSWHDSDAKLSVIALDGDASGYACHQAPDLSGLDADALADESIWRAARSRDAIDLEPGAYDVVISPAAVAELLDWFNLTAFSARAII